MAIMDNDGNRILAKYYDPNVFPSPKEQRAFEKNLFNKTHRANAEIIMLDGLTCVYKSNVDLFFYVMGSSHENEVKFFSFYNILNLAQSTPLCVTSMSWKHTRLCSLVVTLPKALQT
jgi:hypothetical protein